MKHNLQIIKQLGTLFALGLLVVWTSCKVEPLKDPNNPGIVEISEDPSASEIQNLVSGIESGMRIDMPFYWDDVGVVGREFYRLSGSDPRFISDLLGEGGKQLDNNTFYTTNPYQARYRVVKNANILIEGLTNTTAPTISAAQKTIGIAYAHTIQAHELLMNLNLQYTNGVRVDVADPDNLGAFLTFDQSITAIIALLDGAYTDLAANSTESFPFNSTFVGNTAAAFAQFNRALAARCAVYNEDWSGALSRLDDSFFDLTGDLRNGAYYIYSKAGGDLTNPLFFPKNANGEVRVAQISFVPDAEAGDSRLNKVSLRTSPGFQRGLSSDYDVFLYPNNTEPIPLIRNEELVLIYAEAKIQLGAPADLNDAVTALNIIRNAANLPDYAGAVTQGALIDEMLNQRRYSLFGEGHRWIDMRRYDRLSDLPIDRAGDQVFDKFPRPASEQP